MKKLPPKRKLTPVKEGGAKKKIRFEKEERKHPKNVSSDEKPTKAEIVKKSKKEALVFNDKNCDFDLYKQSATNVHNRKIKISNNVILTCRMIDKHEGKLLSYDYAALTLQRKTANEKMFEFVLPLTIAPRLKEGIEIIIQENPTFFSNEK